jgi:uncharacterized membrane protein YqjE
VLPDGAEALESDPEAATDEGRSSMAAQPVGSGVDSDASIGALVAGIQQDVTALVRGELELAKAELRESAARVGIGAGMLAAAAFLSLLAVVLISIALGYGLVALGLHPGLAFLIVAVFYLILAAILGLLGRKRLETIKGPERAKRAATRVGQALRRDSET